MGVEDFVSEREQGTGVAKGKRYWGKYAGFVRDTNDPQQRFRVRFFCPEVMGPIDDDDHWLHWALPCMPVAGAVETGGGLVPPEPGQIINNGETLDVENEPEARIDSAPARDVRREVTFWIEFRQGDPRFPIYVGAFFFAPDDAPNFAPAISRGEQDETLLPPVGAFRIPNETLTVEETNVGTTASTSSADETVEPGPQNATTYPLNRVYKSPSGHVVEFDDTPGEERVRVYHRVGSYIEYNASGSLVTKVVGQHLTFVNESEIHAVLQDARKIINGTYHHQVGGQYTAIRGSEANIQYKDIFRSFALSRLEQTTGLKKMELGSLECVSSGDVLFTSANGVGLSGQNVNLLGLLEAQMTCPTGVKLQGTVPATGFIYDMLPPRVASEGVINGVGGLPAFLSQIATAASALSGVTAGAGAGITLLGAWIAAFHTALKTSQTIHRVSSL